MTRPPTARRSEEEPVVSIAWEFLVLCVEMDCKTFHNRPGGPCPRCGNQKGLLVSRVLDGRPRCDEDDEPERALASAGLPPDSSRVIPFPSKPFAIAIDGEPVKVTATDSLSMERAV